MEFKLESKYSPAGDQPQAIEKLVEGFQDGLKEQVLLGLLAVAKPLLWQTLYKR